MDVATVLISAASSAGVAIVVAYTTARLQSSADERKWRREFARAFADIVDHEPQAQNVAAQFAVGLLVVASEASLSPERYFVPKGCRLTIGRGTMCQIRLDDPRVSKLHAALMADQTTVTVEDLDSTTGVLVNGIRVAGHRPLRSGDIVRLGDTNLEFTSLGTVTP